MTPNAFRSCVIAAAATGLTGCRTAPAPAPMPVVPRAGPACPAPTLGNLKWVFFDDSSGFTLAMPAGFQERSSGASFREWQLEADFQQYMTFGIIRGGLELAGYRRPYQPELMLEYTECSEAIGDYQMSIQSWRTPNGVFRNSRRFDRYDVFAIWEVRPGVYAYISGGTHSRPTQALMLGAIRAWRRRAS